MKTAKSPYERAVYEQNSKIYKLLSNPKRLEILNIIKQKEANVNELSKILNIRKANTSQHLRILRYLRVVRVRKHGKNAYYKIVDPRIVEPCRILKSLWHGDSL